MKLVASLILLSFVMTSISCRNVCGYENKVHGTIFLREGVPIRRVRLAILEAMYNSSRVKWILEEEGDGYIHARFDYRGKSIILNATYTDSQVQLLYVDGDGGFECPDLSDGVCTCHSKNYYRYGKLLRGSLVRHFKAQRMIGARRGR